MRARGKRDKRRVIAWGKETLHRACRGSGAEAKIKVCNRMGQLIEKAGQGEIDLAMAHRCSSVRWTTVEPTPRMVYLDNSADPSCAQGIDTQVQWTA